MTTTEMTSHTQTIRTLQLALALVADQTYQEATDAAAVFPGGTTEAEDAIRLVNYTDAMQLLARAIWHQTKTRRLHDRVRGENVHPAYFTYDDVRLFREVEFDRHCGQGGV